MQGCQQRCLFVAAAGRQDKAFPRSTAAIQESMRQVLRVTTAAIKKVFAPASGKGWRTRFRSSASALLFRNGFFFLAGIEKLRLVFMAPPVLYRPIVQRHR